MKPIKTEDSNFTLVAEGAGDLPAELAHTATPENPEEPWAIIITRWQPDPGERKALANGAPIDLTVWLTPLGDTPPAQALTALLASHQATQPPVSLQAGEPPDDGGQELIDRSHLNRALGYLFGCLNENGSSAPGQTDLRSHAETALTRYLRSRDQDPGDPRYDEVDPAMVALREAIDRSAQPISYPYDFVIQHHAAAGSHGDVVLTIDGFLDLIEEALAATRERPGDDGGSIEDLSLPSDVRKDL